ncbi:MAG TPA: SAM-dependent chlorinase/fluorinase [Edaphocola sp.]|nr:SAM-dependent chlorinase/fluorinase [Edaphocola sp.]
MIVTLISDFGYKDNSIAVSKGILMQQSPHIQIVDITHDVQPFNITQCGYLLKSSYNFFPKLTVHISLFGVLEYKPAVILLIKIDEQYIISADNGLLEFTFDNHKTQIWKLNNSESYTFTEWLKHCGQLLNQLENLDENWMQANLTQHFTERAFSNIQPRLTPEGHLECRVIHIDNYGNIILNIHIDEFEKFRSNRSFTIFSPKHQSIKKFINNFEKLREGDPFSMVNSAGYIQIGLYQGSAADLFGYSIFDPKRLIYDKIKIEFN